MIVSLVDAILAGRATAADLDEWIDDWHDVPGDGSPEDFARWIGLTAAEYELYARWAADGREAEVIALAVARRRDEEEAPGGTS